MRKIICFLILFLFVAILASPFAIASASDELPSGCSIKNLPRATSWSDNPIKDCPTVTSGTVTNYCQISDDNSCAMCCLLSAIYTITDWIFYLMMILFVILFIVAGAIYLTSGGNADSMKRAKGIMIYAIVGLVVALVAKLVPSVVKLIVAM